MILLVLFIIKYSVVIELLTFPEECSTLGHPSPLGQNGTTDKGSDHPPNCSMERGEELQLTQQFIYFFQFVIECCCQYRVYSIDDWMINEYGVVCGKSMRKPAPVPLFHECHIT
jgi:hypothetical protein